MKQVKLIHDRKLRFAITGCGRISENHFCALEKHADRVELVAVCDIDDGALKKAMARTNSQGFKSYSEMLATVAADIVVIATPSGIHSAQTIEAASAGFNVITEKPMATRWRDGLDMVRACDQAGVSLFVVKQNRCNETLQLLKRAIKNGRFGQIYSVAINVFWARPQEYYDSASWRGTWEFDGGALMNQASHYIDLLDWLVGPVESVMAYTATLGRNIEVEDTGVASIRWRNGALGTVNVTMLAYPKNIEGSITILGEKGVVRVGGVAANKIEHWEFAEYHPDDEKVIGANYETNSVYGFGHERYYDNVISTLQGKSEADTNGREGLKSLEILIALYLSARDSRKVSLPLEY